LTIDAETVREQFQRFARHWDDDSRLTDFAALLKQYLSQPLPNSETAWAYRTLANVPACSEHAAEALDVTNRRSRGEFAARGRSHAAPRRGPGL
jgi:hypothetical protein